MIGFLIGMVWRESIEPIKFGYMIGPLSGANGTHGGALVIILLVLLGIGALIGIVATIIDLRRDGYRRIPDRAESHPR